MVVESGVLGPVALIPQRPRREFLKLIWSGSPEWLVSDPVRSELFKNPPHPSRGFRTILGDRVVHGCAIYRVRNGVKI